jgi:phenylalanine-4-hydroxylase
MEEEAMANSKEETRSKSAYEKGAEAGVDPRCIPQKLTGPVPEDDQIIYPGYPQSDHDIWKFLYERQMKLLKGKVCSEYLTGVEKLKFTPGKIPALRDLSSVFKKNTGWTVARVPGLIDVDDFFALLKRKVFPSTDYIRGKDELDYTPAPDLFHDMFGHMPLLTDPNFASFYQKFGEAALHAVGDSRKELETFHWFTVEFGLIKKKEGLRIYGAGIVSSLGEVQHALSEDVEVKKFDPDVMVRQPYDVWHLQPVLFAIESFKQLEDGFMEWTKHRGML